jgi:hypothetical protein
VSLREELAKRVVFEGVRLMLAVAIFKENL